MIPDLPDIQLKRGETLVPGSKDYKELMTETLKIRNDPIYFMTEILNLSPFPKQEEIIRNYYQHKYQPQLPEYKKLVWISGQRSGKTLVGGMVLLYEFHELFSYDNPHRYYNVGIDNRGKPIKLIGVACVSTSKDQARDGVFYNMTTMLDNSEFLQQYYGDSIRTDQGDLRLNYKDKMLFARVTAPRIDTAAGYEHKCVVYDEMDLMQYGSTTQKSDTHGSKIAAHNVYSKLNNSTQTFGARGKIVAISSLQKRDGIMNLAYREAMNEKDAIAYKTATWDVNPSPELTEAVLRERYRSRMDEFFRDFKNMPEVGGSSLFPEGIRMNHTIQNVLLDVTPLDPDNTAEHVMAIDPAATNDSFGIATGYAIDDRIVIDGARKFDKPLAAESYIKPSDIADFVDIQMNRLNVYAFIHDTSQYPNILESVRDKWGIDPIQHHTDAESYGLWRELQNSVGNTQLHIVYDEFLKEECENLESVTRGISNKVNIDHPYKGSKDIADSVCNCIWYLANNPCENPYIPYSGFLSY